MTFKIVSGDNDRSVGTETRPMSYHFRVLKKKCKNLKIPCNKIHQVTSPFPLTQTFFFENKKNKHFESEAKM